jgi:hypothetical protein
MRWYRNLKFKAAMTLFARACPLRGFGRGYFSPTPLDRSELQLFPSTLPRLAALTCMIRDQRPTEAVIFVLTDYSERNLILTVCVGMRLRCNGWCT